MYCVYTELRQSYTSQHFSLNKPEGVSERSSTMIYKTSAPVTKFRQPFLRWIPADSKECSGAWFG